MHVIMYLMYNYYDFSIFTYSVVCSVYFDTNCVYLSYFYLDKVTIIDR